MGTIVSIPAIALAAWSMGGGQSSGSVAICLFPLPILLLPWAMEGLWPVILVIGLAQFPIYGAIITGGSAERMMLRFLILLLAHGLAVGVAISSFMR